MLVKVTTWGRTLEGAANRNLLQEFRIRGVKTNIGFLENVLQHEVFTTGKCAVTFHRQSPELFHTALRFEHGAETLKFIGNVTVNGNPDVKYVDPHKHFRKPIIPNFDKVGGYSARHQKPAGFHGGGTLAVGERTAAHHVHRHHLRDAHRWQPACVPTKWNSPKVSPRITRKCSRWNCGAGNLPDVAMRFLHDARGRRLRQLREAIPNILFQMLFRGSNAVGYTAYPDNVVEAFIEKSSERHRRVPVFDSLNWIEGMRKSIQVVRERTGGLPKVRSATLATC